MSNEEIKINHAAVEAGIATISGAVHYLESVTLNPSDTQTTITANAKVQQVYVKSQQVLQRMQSAMVQETHNIESLGVTFQQYDEQLKEIWNNKVTTSKWKTGSREWKRKTNET